MLKCFGGAGRIEILTYDTVSSSRGVAPTGSGLNSLKTEFQFEILLASRQTRSMVLFRDFKARIVNACSYIEVLSRL